MGTGVLSHWRPTFTGLWLHADFRKFWLGQTTSLLGSQVSQIAIPLTAVLVLQASPAQMGILEAAEAAPWLLVGLFAGVWVDRLRRRPVMIATDLGRAVLLMCVPAAAVLGLLRLELVYAVAFLVGILSVFFGVAYQSFLPVLVQREQLIEGNSKLAMSGSVAQVAGPGLAGVLVQLVTAPIAILVDALSFVVSALAVKLINTVEPPPTPHHQRQSTWREIGEGLGTVFGNPILRAIVGCKGGINLFATVMIAVEALYLVRELGIPPAVYGLIFAVGSLGFLPGALLTGEAVRRFGLGRTMVGALMVKVLADLLIPLATQPLMVAVPLVTTAMLLGSLSASVLVINDASLRQAITPNRLLGRVNATQSVVASGAPVVGALLGGALGEAIGLRPTLVVGALGQVLPALWLIFSPVRSLRTHPAPVKDAPAASH